MNCLRYQIDLVFIFEWSMACLDEQERIEAEGDYRNGLHEKEMYAA
jgi:hypothetical protein